MISCAFSSPTAISLPTWVNGNKESFTATFYPNKKKGLRLSFQASSSPISRWVLDQLSTKNVMISKETETTKESPKEINSPDQHPSKAINTSFRGNTSNKGKDPKRLNSSAADSCKLDHYPIIRYPYVTESAIKLILGQNTLVFIVDKNADKNGIKEAVKETLKVTAAKVNTQMMPDGRKKAYIMLIPECSALDLAKKIKVM